MRACAVLIAATVGWGLVACGAGFNSMSGGDESRGAAQVAPLEQSIDDRVSAVEGDHTDWKKFTLASDSQVAVMVWWDTPSFEGQIRLKDELGQKLKTLKHAAGTRQESLGPVSLKKGSYFLEIEATAEASVYTLEIRTKSQAAPVKEREPEPDF